jgi:transposase
MAAPPVGSDAPADPPDGIEDARATRVHLSANEKRDVWGLVFREKNALTISQAALAKKCSPRTVKRALSEIAANGDPADPAGWGGFRTAFFTDDEKAVIRNWVDDHPDLTLREIQAKCFSEWGKAPRALSTIARILDEMKYTLKRVSLVPKARNDPPTIAGRHTYAQRFQEVFLQMYSRHRVVFLDETGFNLHIRRGFARSLAGTSACVVVPTSRGRHISCCLAMTCDEVIAAVTILGAFNQWRFVAFLEALRQRLVQRDAAHRWLVVMDNVAFHKTEVVTAWAAEHDANVALEYLPPYSPFLDPCEECFSFVKNEVRRVMRERPVNEWTTPALRECLHERLNHSIPAAHCDAWCRHSEAFFPRCIASEPIWVDAESANVEGV